MVERFLIMDFIVKNTASYVSGSALMGMKVQILERH